MALTFQTSYDQMQLMANIAAPYAYDDASADLDAYLANFENLDLSNYTYTTLTSSLVVAESGLYALSLAGSGIGPVSSGQALEDAINDGLATGDFDSLTFTYGGVTLAELLVDTTGYDLSLGPFEIAVDGALPTSFEQLSAIANDFNYVLDNLDTMTQAERDAIVSRLSAYNLAGITVVYEGEELLSTGVSDDEVFLDTLDYNVSITGTLPGDFGDLALVLFDVADVLLSGDEVTEFNFSTLDPTDITLSDPDGTVVMQASGDLINNLAEDGLIQVAFEGQTFGHVFIDPAHQGTDFATYEEGPDLTPALMMGFGGNDSLSGSSAGDWLFGGTGDDQLMGMDGNDTLTGEEGADMMDGGEGTDLADYSMFDGRVIVDIETDLSGRAFLRFFDGGVAEGDTWMNIENITGGEYADNLRGDANANTLMGGGVSDRLYGRDGDDILMGGTGADALYGNLGVDIMTGGEDAGRRDRYIYFFAAESGVGAGNRDIITDFVAGEDRIEIGRLDADTTQGLKQSFDFIGDAGFSGVAGELGYRQEGGNTIVEADTDGDMIADFEIELTGLMDLGVDDFYI